MLDKILLFELDTGIADIAGGRVSTIGFRTVSQIPVEI